MVQSPLTRDDFWGLLDLLSGLKPQLSPDQIMRLQRKGLLSPGTMTLTGSGRDQARLFTEYVEAVRKGIPGNTPHQSLSANALTEQYYWWTRHGRDRITWNKHMVIHHFDFRPPKRQFEYTDEKIKQWEPLLSRWRRTARSNSTWIQAEPLAIQNDGSRYGEYCMVFRRIPAHSESMTWSSFATQPSVIRIQLRYYDLLTELCPDGTWWIRTPDQKNKLVGFRDPKRKGLGERFIALLCPVKTINWPIPFWKGVGNHHEAHKRYFTKQNEDVASLIKQHSYVGPCDLWNRHKAGEPIPTYSVSQRKFLDP